MWDRMADMGVVSAVVGALLAALASLGTAYFSYKSMKDAESSRRHFEVLMYDLTLLNGLRNRLLTVDLPSVNRIVEALEEFQLGDRRQIDRVSEDVKEPFKKNATAFIAHKVIFDADLWERTELALNRVNESEKSDKLGLIAAVQIEALEEFVAVLDEQVARNRGRASGLDGRLDFRATSGQPAFRP